mmetsp:Transcript_20450/g.57019  ORF Transcript_20450/g.57019 Transcript_20450/m.57019 type:complete len:94 (-) Transcript_20450:798-1079(-)|eukprot:scaffold267591_cov23-Tisochrysis_lutea.AAC.1
MVKYTLGDSDQPAAKSQFEASAPFAQQLLPHKLNQNVHGELSYESKNSNESTARSQFEVSVHFGQQLVLNTLKNVQWKSTHEGASKLSLPGTC